MFTVLVKDLTEKTETFYTGDRVTVHKNKYHPYGITIHNNDGTLFDVEATDSCDLNVFVMNKEGSTIGRYELTTYTHIGDYLPTPAKLERAVKGNKE